MSNYKLAVIGNPISHSLSPHIHHDFAKQFGINLKYEAIESPLDGFADTLKRLQDENYLGANVTVPFKLDAFNLAGIRDDYAALAQAANTLVFNENSTHAYNTDGLGLVKDIKESIGLDLKDKSVLILGAGGAVQGIIKPLFDAGIDSLTIANRTYSKAQTLAKSFSAHGQIFAVQMGLLPLTMAFDIVINGTSASLDNDSLDIPSNLVSKDSLCYDLVYSTKDTPFIEWAKAVGVKQTHDGLGMLIEQAALAFSIWFQEKPDTVHTKKQLLTVLNT